MLAHSTGGEQAAGLRHLHRTVTTRAICVTSGKGGVGKTHVAVNLAIAVARKGKEVMVLDADLGMANVDVILGLRARYNLAHVLAGERRLEDIVVRGPAGISVVPAGSGVRQLLDLPPAQQAGLIGAFSELGDGLDVLVIDAPAGLSRTVAMFCRAAHDVVVVVCDEPASITDAYAVIKCLSRDYGLERFHVLTNRVASIRHGWELFGKLNKVAARFLNVTLEFFGAVPEDPKLRYAVQSQRAVIEAFPGSRAAAGFKRLAVQLERWSAPRTTRGYAQFFLGGSVAVPADGESLSS